MIDVERFFEQLKANLAVLVEEQWREHRDAALHDGRAFVQTARADLERWLRLLEEGALTREDFAWLVQGKKDLAELEALKQAGLASARLDRFRMALVDTVIGTALRIV
jgi:hypothetical protein